MGCERLREAYTLSTCRSLGRPGQAGHTAACFRKETTMNSKFKAAVDTVLDYTVNRFGGAPGVVAMATDRNGNVYEGAVGKRELGKDQPITTDSVFAIFSTTKAVTGVTVMQLVEEGKISLSDPAKKYVPAIGELRVL